MESGGFVYGERTDFTALILGCIDASDSGSMLLIRTFGELQDFHAFAPLRPQNFSKASLIQW